MIPDYHFKSEHVHAPGTRWQHFLFYLGALLLLIAAAHSLWMYFTHWSTADDDGNWWDLALGITYLLVGLLLAYYTYAHTREHAKHHFARTVTIEKGIMTYQLEQISGVQRVDLSRVASALRVSIRDLQLDMKDGSQVHFPIYLVDEEHQQRELEKILLAL